MYLGKWALLLSVFWLLLSGYFKALLLFFGGASVLLVVVVLKRMDEVDQEPEPLNLGFSTMRYFLWLIGQIVISSVEVTKLIWGSSKKLSPAIAKISAENIAPNNRVLYANSITLTPGTLSVDLEEDGMITVHALDGASIEDLKQGGIEKKMIEILGTNK